MYEDIFKVQSLNIATSGLREELVAAVFHPTRFARLLQTYGYDLGEEDYVTEKYTE